MTPPPSGQRTGTGRYSLLLGALALLFLMAPILEDRPEQLEFLDEMVAAILLAAVLAVRQHRVGLAVTVLLAVVSRLAAWFGHSQATVLVSLSAEFAFFVLIGGLILSDVLADRRVRAGTLAGAVCVYLLIGMAWTDAFSLVVLVHPGAIHFGDVPPRTHTELYLSLFYFSFVTLTTAGFGDIAPVGNTARSLAILEAVAGQLFLAILIARLVGLHALPRRRRRRRPRTTPAGDAQAGGNTVG